jgi:hypothetical protein
MKGGTMFQHGSKVLFGEKEEPKIIEQISEAKILPTDITEFLHQLRSSVKSRGEFSELIAEMIRMAILLSEESYSGSNVEEIPTEQIGVTGNPETDTAHTVPLSISEAELAKFQGRNTQQDLYGKQNVQPDMQDFVPDSIGYITTKDAWIEIIPFIGESADNAIARVAKEHNFDPSLAVKRHRELSPKQSVGKAKPKTPGVISKSKSKVGAITKVISPEMSEDLGE